MQTLTINRTDGNLLASLEGQDHISGLLFLVAASGDVPSAFSTNSFAACSSLSTATTLGLTSGASGIAGIAWYHINEVLRLNPGATLYVGFAVRNSTFSVIADMQQFAGGNIRQLGIWDMTVAPTSTIVTNLQTQATALDALGQPLSIIYAPKVTALTATALPRTLASNAPNVSIVIGQDKAVYDTTTDAVQKGIIGTVIGLISRSAVNESIAWVAKNETGLSLAAFGNGALYRDTDTAVLAELDTARYIYLRTYAGLSGVYLNDSHNLANATGDYNSIERERTMDKAVRGIRTYLLPELGRPVHFNTDGTLRADTIKHLQTVAGKQLEDMEKDGEIDGWTVEIDASQNVLSTSQVVIYVKALPIGVMRQAVVNIGYTDSLS